MSRMAIPIDDCIVSLVRPKDSNYSCIRITKDLSFLYEIYIKNEDMVKFLESFKHVDCNVVEYRPVK